MPRPYLGPKLWLDPRRGSWTILDGRKRIRTGLAEHDHLAAEEAIQEYANGTYRPERPKGPTPNYKVAPRKGVYVVGFGAYVKIGITANLDVRLSQLQTPEPVSVYALLPGWAREERDLHERFAEYRMQGEWFLKKDRLSDWIDGGCSPHPLQMEAGR